MYVFNNLFCLALYKFEPMYCNVDILIYRIICVPAVNQRAEPDTVSFVLLGITHGLIAQKSSMQTPHKCSIKYAVPNFFSGLSNFWV